MTDPKSDIPAEPPQPEPSKATDMAGVVGGADADAAALERRAFVRQMGSGAFRTAGTVFGLTRILTRTAAGVGQQVVGGLERMQVGNAADEVEVPADMPMPAPLAEVVAEPATEPVPAAVVMPEPPPAPVVPPKPEVRIDPADLEVLESATTAVVAVNRDGHPPQLTTAKVLWDGSTVRFLSLGWSRRVTMLRSDPRVGLLIDGSDGRFVTVAGRAQIVDGIRGREASWPVLLREHGDEDAAEAAWAAMVAEDRDRAVVIIEPEQVLAGRR